MIHQDQSHNHGAGVNKVYKNISPAARGQLWTVPLAKSRKPRKPRQPI